jgi:hypothetical protein
VLASLMLANPTASETIFAHFLRDPHILAATAFTLSLLRMTKKCAG